MYLKGLHHEHRQQKWDEHCKNPCFGLKFTELKTVEHDEEYWDHGENEAKYVCYVCQPVW